MSAARRKRAPARDTALHESAPVFAALGDETRRSRVSRLVSSGATSTAVLTEGTGMTRQAVTKHLNALAGAGLVRDAWQGRERVWEIEPHRLLMARRFLDRISA